MLPSLAYNHIDIILHMKRSHWYGAWQTQTRWEKP